MNKEYTEYKNQDLGRLLWQFKYQIGIVFHQLKNTNINYILFDHNIF